jgi:hypothetical protein
MVFLTKIIGFMETKEITPRPSEKRTELVAGANKDRWLRQAPLKGAVSVGACFSLPDGFPATLGGVFWVFPIIFQSI